ncbi:peptidase S10, serine carboxypeptidase [Auricularia subglabra TFB-10046 SS5]|uniref:Carboxypeptidase n=1 Tax=Auricularia subglabra (strain TFB-10046 / SS5) TaxID=717982 RepID=J0WUX9_AURST|nr:peptidase S10, serine carboxypeptidase [Auricularia subglabra TFB-10046 SS5]
MLLSTTVSTLLLAGGTLASYAPLMQMPVEFPAPEQDLHALSSVEFTTLTHPSYPAHKVRIKRNDGICDDKVKSYSGYIDIEARHLFFYFFESRNDPDADPVLMWINGGPGCSSAIGAFMELGPCNIHDANGPKYNPYSWNSNANLFFLDEPIGVGFSYAEHGETVATTEEAAVDVAAFVTTFFETFKKFQGRPFHMSGESYGGRYLPVFASAVYDSNAKALAEGRTPINLQSVLIGNGITDFSTQAFSLYDLQCTNASVEPFLPISTCVRMKAALPRCKAWIQQNCLDQYDALSCQAASAFCSSELSAPFALTGRNRYDVSRPCEGEPSDLCYPLTRHIREYLDQPHVRKNLGVHKAIGNFSSCSSTVGTGFHQHQDGLHLSAPYVAELLQRGVRVLIYVGTYDLVCNWVGNLAWTTALEWPGHEAFAGTEFREWAVDGARAGLTKSAGPLTYATVEAAGHMVPYDKPVQALQLLNRWLSSSDL